MRLVPFLELVHSPLLWVAYNSIGRHPNATKKDIHFFVTLPYEGPTCCAPLVGFFALQRLGASFH